MKGSAQAKSTKIEEHVRKIVREMDCDGGDGQWVANTLENVKGKVSESKDGGCWVDQQILDGGKSMPVIPLMALSLSTTARLRKALESNPQPQDC